jgi:RNA polymerase sigma-70 factor (ECF subfamily)
MYGQNQKSSDSEIVRRVLEGNVNAFEGLMERYGDHVLMIVKKHVPYTEVDETTQDVFIRAYQSLASFQSRDRFKSWLSTVAVRTCYDYWRRAYKSREIPMSFLSDRHREWLEEVMSEQSCQFYQDRGAMKEAREVLEWALERLSPEDRMVLELVYLEGLSGKEAAAQLGWSVANVKIRSFRSRKKLEKLLKGALEEEARISS